MQQLARQEEGVIMRMPSKLSICPIAIGLINKETGNTRKLVNEGESFL